MFVQGCSRSLKACRPRVSFKPSYSSSLSRRSFVSLVCFAKNGGVRPTAPGAQSSSCAAPCVSFGSRVQLIHRMRRDTKPAPAQIATYTTTTTSPKYAPVKDDSHPSLFYHLFDADGDALNPVFSLSFLEERPRNARSKTVLGWLPAVSPADAENSGNGLDDFVPNQAFLPILHRVVKDGLLEDEMWVNSAIQTQSGWMHVFDQRNIPMPGRIPDPDDIFASVRVEDGRMLIDTYEPMPSYRLCTADGVCQLTDTLMDRLKNALQRIAKEEEREERQRQNH